MTNAQRILGLGLIIAALCLLYPGVTQPVLTLSGTIEKSQLAALGVEMIAGDADPQTRSMLLAMSSFLGLDSIEGQLQAYHSTQSIWGTARNLADTGNGPVAALIVLFSVIIPTVKLLLQALAMLPTRALPALLWLNKGLSKWSMTDVFVMALLVAYMAGSASGKMGDMLLMHAQLEVGFYWFLGYCLFSIATTALLRINPGTEPTPPASR